MDQRISVKLADVVDFPCDVLVLKFAQGFYGADELVATKLSNDPEQDIRPEPGSYVLLPSSGKVAAKNVLFVGVRHLNTFDYTQIRKFASYALQVLSEKAPDASHIAMTMHGVGYGLDEKESFLAQIGGVLDALSIGTVPPTLQRVTIVERNPARASRLEDILADNLPPEFSAEIPKSSERTQVPGIKAGKRSEEKPHVFVAMPFSDEMEDVYIFGIQAPVNGAGFLCERVDMSVFTGDILTRIKSRIETAALVIADLTGSNPNVYLEVGYAWGKDRSTLLLSKQTDELKFDVRGQRTLIYKSISDLARKLEADLATLK